MFINKITKEYPVYENDIVDRNPNTIFPNPFVPTNEYEKVEPSEKPQYDHSMEKVVENPPIESDGVWVQQWLVVPLTPEEIQETLPEELTQFERDQSRYKKRAAVKDEMLAYMAADNMKRVRNGDWTVEDLTTLLSDPAVAAANTFMSTLSFELAASSIQSATTPLLTTQIKTDWVGRLQSHYYLEG